MIPARPLTPEVEALLARREERGLERLRHAGYEPASPWPGREDHPWSVRCACGAVRVSTLRRVEGGEPCRTCWNSEHPAAWGRLQAQGDVDGDPT